MRTCGASMRDLELREAVDQWESPPDRHDRGCPAAVASSARCTCVIPPGLEE